jgi:hypothetical protein
LEEEIAKLERNNKDLDELVNYLQTDSFKEKEAKEKLNLIKEGEQLVLVKGNNAKKEEIVKEKELAEVAIKHSKAYWWWHYFFGAEKNEL